MKDCIHCAITFVAKLNNSISKAIWHRHGPMGHGSAPFVIVGPKQGVEVRCSSNYIWLYKVKLPVKSYFKTSYSFGCVNYDQPVVTFKRKILQCKKARKEKSSLFVAGRLFHVNQIRDRAGIGVVSHCWEVFVDRFETGIDGLLLEGVETSDQAAN